MIPTPFADLGKKAKDLFDKNFYFGKYKFEHKSKASKDIEINVLGTHLTDSKNGNNVDGQLEAKYKISDYGVTISEKLTTSSVLTAGVTVEEKILKGLKNTFELQLEPNNGKLSGKVKNGYKRPYVNMNLDLNFKTIQPEVLLNCVLGCEDERPYLAGASVLLKTSTNEISNFQYALGYAKNDFQIHTSLANHKDLQASVYQKLSPVLETAVNVDYTPGDKAPSRFAVVGKYTLSDKKSFLKAKVDTNSVLGMAYCFNLASGFFLTLSGQLNGNSLTDGNHKLGCALEFES